MKKANIYTYIGALLALFAIVAGALGFMDPQIVWGLAGLFGFGSVVALRTWIEAKGWKTYFVGGLMISLSVLLLLGIIDLQMYKVLLGAFGPVTSITVQQALVKEKNET